MIIRMIVRDCEYGDVVMVIDRSYNVRSKERAIKLAIAHAEKFDLEDHQVITSVYALEEGR